MIENNVKNNGEDKEKNYMNKSGFNFVLFLVIFIWSNFYMSVMTYILFGSEVYDVEVIRYNMLFFGIGNGLNSVKFINIPSIISLGGMGVNGYLILKKWVKVKK